MARKRTVHEMTQIANELPVWDKPPVLKNGICHACGDVHKVWLRESYCPPRSNDGFAWVYTCEACQNEMREAYPIS